MTVFSAFLPEFSIFFNSRELPVIRVNFFLENKDIDRLLKLGFSAQTHRFNANSLALDLAGKTEAENGILSEKQIWRLFCMIWLTAPI